MPQVQTAAGGGVGRRPCAVPKVRDVDDDGTEARDGRCVGMMLLEVAIVALLLLGLPRPPWRL